MPHTTNRTPRRAKRQSQVSPPSPRHSTLPRPSVTNHGSGWELYHFIGAFAIVFGVAAAAHNAGGLIQHLEHMSSVEESGLAAAVIICLRGFGGMFQSLSVAIATILTWWSRLGK